MTLGRIMKRVFASASGECGGGFERILDCLGTPLGGFWGGGLGVVGILGRGKPLRPPTKEKREGPGKDSSSIRPKEIIEKPKHDFCVKYSYLNLKS